ncbi:helix-turn-helix transcriptional regulator [Nonomuraea sp. NEAU-A123]|uniref:helix-turn-helix domain-containing protein n=1 Tax=Nonomuraea sp. NEAU-A123 TaxID=2839649 RepID=UPI001BE3E953|nr:helix-turn-helix transcriptional regulator [Nonomuraea sp. NEAU-A123]MBT2224357.1 helix-turn-helix domain-containing protein [Nonomuraea sp. NEAU-A123]
MADGDIGNRIRELRRKRRLSQADLVKPGLLSASYLSLIESGQRRPSSEVLRHLAELLDTTPEHLLTGRHPASWQETERRLAFAELALHNSSPQDALSEFEAVLDEGPPPLHPRARLGRARALELLGRTEEALNAYEALWKAAESGTGEWAERATDVLRCSRDAGDFSYACDLGERAMAAFEELGLPWSDEVVRLGVSLAGVYIVRDDLTRASRLLQRLIEVSDDMGSPLARGSAYWNAAIVAHHRARDADAKALADRALALFGETDHHRNLAVLRHTYGSLLLETKDAEPVKAREILLDAHDRLTSVGGPVELRECEVSLSRAATQLGEPEEALRWAQAARSRIASGTSRAGEAQALITLGLAQITADHRDDGIATLAQGEHALEQATPGRAAVDLWNRLAVHYEQRGDAAAALRAYRQAMKAAGYRLPATERTTAGLFPPK